MGQPSKRSILDYLTGAVQSARQNPLVTAVTNQVKREVAGFNPSAALDVINRGTIAGTIGAPVDMVNMALPKSLQSQKPIMGSEWIGDQMQNMGMVSRTRRPAMETLAGFINPEVGATGAAKNALFLGGAFAKSQDLAAGMKALKMERAGIEPEKIWAETGWGRAPWDKQWRFEIDDSVAGFDAAKGVKKNIREWKKTNQDERVAVRLASLVQSPYHPNITNVEEAAKAYPTFYSGKPSKQAKIYAGMDDETMYNTILDDMKKRFPLGSPKENSWQVNSGDLLDYPEFYRNYPEAKDIPLRFHAYDFSAPHQRAYFAPDEGIIGVNPSHLYEPQGKNSLLHEFQHWLQKREGFTGGGSIPSNIGQYSEEARNRMIDQYLRTAGEAEARLVQGRETMPAVYRRMYYPWDEEHFKALTGADINNLYVP